MGLGVSMRADPEARVGQWRPGTPLMRVSLALVGGVSLQASENIPLAQPWDSGCRSPYRCIFLHFVPSVTEGKTEGRGRNSLLAYDPSVL